MPKPTNVAVVLLDSLNRHMLGSYGGTEFTTPNLDRFASERATRFTNHVTGSLPCMPARHDILVGALDFLWKCWGSIELWERPITADLTHAGVATQLVSDHPHLFETGGENYHTDFLGWSYERGHEGDPWRTYADPSWVGAPTRPAGKGGWFYEKAFGMEMPERAYDRARTFFRSEEDFPGPKTMSAAAAWLRDATPHHDRWFLFVDEFDPHEPFDTPEPWLGRYEDEPWDDELIIWPPYVEGGVTKGHITDAEGRHIRANYGSKLSMIDHWFGRVLDAFDEGGLWEDTALIVCTDHGHYLGDERNGNDIWGKPGVPQYEPLGHTPLLIHWPGVDGGGTCDALTTNVDIHATIRDVYEVRAEHQTHGRSMAPLLDGSATSIREWAIGGDLRQLGPGHRWPTQVRRGRPRATGSPCRCGRTAGRRCRSTSPASRRCRHPMPEHGSTRCPAARSRSSASRTRRATRCRCGPAPADGSATITSTTSTSIPTSRRTAAASRRWRTR